MRLCSVKGCERKHQALGYCDLHYARLRRTGSPNLAKPGPESPGWGRGKPGGGRYWTKVRIGRALKAYAETHDQLQVSDHEWNAIKRGRLDLPPSAAILKIWHTMARAWLAVGVDRKRLRMTLTRWSKGELEFLLANAGSITLEEIATRLNRSYGSVRSKLGAKGMGIKARENAGYMSAQRVAQEYNCPVKRVLALIDAGLLPATYWERGHRWQIDAGAAAKVRHLLIGPKRTHKDTPPDVGDYRQRYGIRRFSVHENVVQLPEAAS